MLPRVVHLIRLLSVCEGMLSRLPFGIVVAVGEKLPLQRDRELPM